MTKKVYYELDADKHGVGGIITVEPKPREQDLTFRPNEFHAVVFFPKIEGIGPAEVRKHTLVETLSNSPEAAISKFMDNIREGATWEQYVEAGWKVRKILVSDGGPGKGWKSDV